MEKIKDISSHKIKLRNTQLSDYEDIKEIMDLVYSNAGGAWYKEDLESHLQIFPDGQICIEDNGKVVAAVSSVVVKYSEYGDNHLYEEIIGDGTLKNHDPDGDTLYGVDICIHPAYQGLRLGRRLYNARKELCRKLNLKRIIIGGRIPRYQDHADKMTPQEYVEKVRNKELHDPVLNFQLSNDFHYRKIMKKYFPEDKESKHFAVLLEWINIYYEEKQKPIIPGKRNLVRLGIIQWQMRPVGSVTEFLKQVEYFIDAVSDYKTDFILFPELFNIPLMTQFNNKTVGESIRNLASFTEEIRDRMLNMAISFNTNIIAGSMPYHDGSNVFNVSYLLKRDGTCDKQYKIHVTPEESSFWGLKNGNNIKVFKIDDCRIGILTGYDIEFPELSRILTDKGAQILFVPFSADTKNSYNRIRYCAHARAIENECYVAIAGSVGNLPNVKNMGIQYAQSAVLTPSDFSFSHDCIGGEAPANAETTLIVDVDLDLLKEVRVNGSVRNSEDRRKDLYKIEWYGNKLN
jgi:predicted amidohydrolase/GNAT superfamily N-acetyltransferase